MDLEIEKPHKVYNMSRVLKDVFSQYQNLFFVISIESENAGVLWKQEKVKMLLSEKCEKTWRSRAAQLVLGFSVRRVDCRSVDHVDVGGDVDDVNPT